VAAVLAWSAQPSILAFVASILSSLGFLRQYSREKKLALSFLWTIIYIYYARMGENLMHVDLHDEKVLLKKSRL
jgi:hypothetical protein